MTLRVGISLVLVLGFLPGELSHAATEGQTSDLHAQCKEAGFVMSLDSKKPSFEEQVAFVRDHPECPPYDWWEVMRDILKRPLLVELEHLRLEVMYQTFPKGTRFPTIKLVSYCGMCEDAQRALALIQSIDHEGCELPAPPTGLPPGCSSCQSLPKKE